jgi:hypothetical protein
MEAEMAGFSSWREKKRIPAAPLQPVVDPAGWSADELRDVARWSYDFAEEEKDELVAAVAEVRRRGVALVDIERAHFPLRRTADLLEEVRHELKDGRGIVMLRGFPLDRLDREGQAIAYLGLGAYLGEKMPQNGQGHILGHVKDLGGDYEDPTTRGYMTRAEMRFHTDPSHYVGLLCLQEARSGGESRVVSSITMYNEILRERPDLVAVLCQDFYRTLSGETNPGEKPWFKQPIFFFCEGHLSATGLGAAIDKAHRLPGVPPLTALQKEAIQAYRSAADRLAVDVGFRRGDIQLLNNFVMLHTRRGYEDWPEDARKRHLLRMWMFDADGRPIPKEQREGRSGRGIRLQGVPLSAPLEVHQLA